MPLITVNHPQSSTLKRGLPVAHTPKKVAMVAAVTNHSFKRFLKYWLPVIVYAIIIFHFSSLPGEEIPVIFSYQDLVFHILEYALLSFLVIRALKAYNPGGSRVRRFLLALLICVFYAIIDEFHQSFVPGRCASVIDVTYDSAGVFLSTIFYR